MASGSYPFYVRDPPFGTDSKCMSPSRLSRRLGRGVASHFSFDAFEGQSKRMIPSLALRPFSFDTCTSVALISAIELATLSQFSGRDLWL